MASHRVTGSASGATTAALLGVLLTTALERPLRAQGPAWLEPRFHSGAATLTGVARSLSLVEDGLLDLRLIERDGVPALLLLEPGTIVVKPLADAAFAPPASAAAALLALDAAEQRALSLAERPDGAPEPLTVEARLDRDHVYFVRTIRPASGGGGAFARFVCHELGGSGAALVARFTFEKLVLDPAKSLLPRRADAYYEQAPRFDAGEVVLFDESRFHHPSYGNFDLLRLDRDHLEWSGEGGLWSRRARLVNDVFDVAELGFSRRLTVVREGESLANGGQRWRWVDEKLAGAATARITLLDPAGEPIRGAWVVARTSVDLAAPASFRCVQSDEQGRVLLPIAPGDERSTIPVVAFEAGARARFGTRVGAEVAAGGGGECVVILDQTVTTTLPIAPKNGGPLPSHCGVRFATGSFLVRVPSDGVLRLPATGDLAEVEFGEPFRPLVRVVSLVAGAAAAIELERTAGHERRVRLLDAESGMPIDHFSLDPQAERGHFALKRTELLADGLLVPAEFERAEIPLAIRSPHRKTAELLVVPGAPREQELALEPDSK